LEDVEEWMIVEDEEEWMNRIRERKKLTSSSCGNQLKVSRYSYSFSPSAGT
jgi:hypothetical protein